MKMQILQRTVAAWAGLWIVLGMAAAPAVAASRRTEDEIAQVQRYLQEVRSHLGRSYFFRERVDFDAVDRAAVDGLIRGVQRRAVGSLTEEQEELLRGIIREFGTSPAEAVRAALLGADELGGRVDAMAWADFAANAMVRAAGDPYGRVLTMAQLRRLMRMLGGEPDPSSIGVSVHPEEDALRVDFTMYGWAAYEAGLKIGDRITHIDGRGVAQMDPDDIPEAISLAGRDRLTLTVRRPGYAEPFDLIVERVEPPGQVLFGLIEGEIGYVRLTIFDMRSAGEVRRALDRLAADGMRSLILDLRYNPGGDLRAAQAIADEFVGPGRTIARTQFSYRPLGGLQLPGLTPPEVLESRGGGRFEDLPMVVLVNGASASASELVAGAVQRIGRARLVGTPTLGKGVGQGLIPIGGLFSGSGRFLYLTIMRYYIGGDTPVGEEGISPDVRVEEPQLDEVEFRALLELRSSGSLREYARGLIARDRERARRLAGETEGLRLESYPEVPRWGAAGRLSRERLAQALRVALQRELASQAGERWVFDVDLDPVLRRAVGLLTNGHGERAQAPSPEQLRQVVEWLAAPERRGRGVGTPESEAAARWIAGRFEELGLEPLECGRFHEFRVGDLTMRNVVGLLRAPAGADGYVVVAAHHDGQGVVRGVVHPGADDNASGVAAVLAVAQLARERRAQLRRHLVFVCFDGEESGLVGSRRFVRDRILPPEQVHLFVVFDLIGGQFLPGDDRLYAMGTEHSPEVEELVRRLASGREIRVAPVSTYVIEPFGPLAARSDYQPFRAEGVPYLFFSTATPWYYHTPNDTPDRLDYEKMARAVRFAFDVVVEAAESARRPTFVADPAPRLEDARVLLDGIGLILDEHSPISLNERHRAGLVESQGELERILERGEMGPEDRRILQRAMLRVFQVISGWRPRD